MTTSASIHRLAVLAACAGPAACSGATAPATATAPAITGVNRVTHWDAHGRSFAVPVSPDAVFLEAQWPGTPEIRAADLADDGTFAIAGPVPDGPYWLRIVDGRLDREDLYLWTDAAQLDLGRDMVGRDRGLAESIDTQLIVDADGLATWQDGDDGDLLMPDLGHWSSLVTFYAANGPVAGDTSLNALTYDWLAQPLPAVGTGDDAFFVQVRPAHDDALGLDYTAPTEAFHSDPIALADGAAAHVTGGFVELPAFDVPVHWARSAFVDAGAAMHVASCDHAYDFSTYWVHALPGAGAHGDLARIFGDPRSGVPESGPRVVDDTFADGTADLDGTLHVGNPYPAEWLFARYAVSFVLDCPGPGGAGTPGNAEAEIAVVTAGLDPAPVMPLVGPVGDVQIAPPAVRWSAPAIGTATSYELHLLELDRAATLFGGASLHEDAELIVPGDVTSITLPADLLAPGTLYVFRIRAIARGNETAATAPFRAGMPLGYADFYTEYFQP